MKTFVNFLKKGGPFVLVILVFLLISSACLLPQTLTTPKPKPKPKPKPQPQVVIIAQSAKKRIVIIEPRRGEKITTPVQVVGRIKGEIPSGFEVQIRDSKGGVLGQAGTLELGWGILRRGKEDWTDFSFSVDFVSPMIKTTGELYAYLEGVRGGPFEDELSMEVVLASAAESEPEVLVKRMIIDRGWATGPGGFGKEAGKWALEVKSKTKTKAVIQTGLWKTDAIYQFELEKKSGIWRVIAEKYIGI